MAERRMFAKTIIDSDAFLDMPVTSRLLYYDLGMRADDDGFVNSPKKIMKMVGASQDDIGILIARKFIIPFDNGVVVIKHRRIHNYIRQDTYNETQYKEQKELLEFDENKSYRLIQENPSTDRPRLVHDSSTQVSIGKDSIDKVSIGEDICASPAEPTKPSAPQKHKYGEYKNVLLTDEEYEKLQNEFPNDYEERIERLSSYIASKGAKYK
ncbi:MAG: replisome organizer, partial [Clostridia bacterium]|nr:replisome organizer [Clostridia bacterium]